MEVGADVSRFLKKGVSDAVKGAALKKLFADPAYNFISDMDDYVEDYSQMATMTTLEVRNLQQSQDLHLFEDPPWKVEAQAKAKAEAEAQPQLKTSCMRQHRYQASSLMPKLMTFLKLYPSRS